MAPRSDAGRAADHGDARPSGGCSVRIGFTATRKLGGAVERNRAKRRLRAAAQGVMPGRVLPGHDYVLVARANVLKCGFSSLEADLASALAELLTKNRAVSQAASAASSSGSSASS
jgi:ribonuclease P protein component